VVNGNSLAVLYQDLRMGRKRKESEICCDEGREAYNLMGVQVPLHCPLSQNVLSEHKPLGCQHPIKWNEVNYYEEGRIQRLSNRNQ
jgi:hypothetical protein